MAHPKRKISKTRRDKRRTHDKVTDKQLASCSNCGATVQYHRICADCGHYRGVQAIQKAETL